MVRGETSVARESIFAGQLKLALPAQHTAFPDPQLPFEPVGIVIAILFCTFLLGFFLDWIEITLIVLPLVAPVVVDLGFDLVWFTVLFAVCLQTSFLTPPVGFAIFYLKGVAPDGVGTAEIYRGVVPFIALQLLGIGAAESAVSNLDLYLVGTDFRFGDLLHVDVPDTPHYGCFHLLHISLNNTVELYRNLISITTPPSTVSK